MNRNTRRMVSLRFLFAVTFLCQMIVAVVGIAVPIYANRLGASPFLVGLIGAAGGLIYSFMPLVAGILCDRFSRKVFVSVSLICYGASCLLYSLVEEPSMLVFAKALEWFSVAAFWPSVEALITDSVEERLEEALKKFNVSWGSATVIGPVLGGALISGWSIKVPFLFSLLVSVCFGLLSLLIVEEPPRRREARTKPLSKPKDETNDPSSTVPALTSILLFSSTTGIILALFPSYATNLGILPFDIGLITFAFGAAKTVTFYQANRIEARLKKLGTFLLGSSTIALASLLTFSTTNILMFTICFLIFGFGSGISYAASISFILGRWKSSRGYAAGVFESLIGLGYFAGPLIGGIISEYSPNAPYFYGFILSLAVLFIQLASRGGGQPKRRHLVSSFAFMDVGQ